MNGFYSEFEGITSYDAFIRRNRIRVNRALNRVLWSCVLAGPAIATGIYTGAFPEVSYDICVHISAYVFIVAFIHRLILRKKPDSFGASLFMLLAFNFLLVYMAYSHVAIYLTWFLVPLLSMPFCDLRIYAAASAVNYILMHVATWLIAPYQASVHDHYSGALEYFLNYFGGFTIEYCIMFIAGLALVRTFIMHFRDLIEKYKTIRMHEDRIEEQFHILFSMAEIYERVNLIDFAGMTEMSLRDDSLTKIPIDLTKQDHTVMTQALMKHVAQDQLDDFIRFTDLTTVRARLQDQRSISAEFINLTTGWFRAQYITIDAGEDKVPVTVIFTVQNIEAEKQREEQLIRIAMTDELTRVYNRRSYDEDMEAMQEDGPEADLAILSVDVNSLKVANDSFGHAAGDEMIRAAADCLVFTVGVNGRVYRTGGDEFIAVVHTKNAGELAGEIKRRAAE